VLVAYVVITLITIIANVAIAVADVRRAEFVLANSVEVGVPQSWLPRLAVLKAAGAVGLFVGLVGVVLNLAVAPYLGIAAAVGLILFFTGALVAHLRARVFYNLYFPGIYWLLAVASLVLALAQ
jgi:DoxX-like protein